ncbi:MAG: TAXI family TRAP transporter solute-binding subunit [Mesorhizobium sp.]|nr:TAXI family TRAP transporter solute-binding subunit [Mesorhizobium sp.]
MRNYIIASVLASTLMATTAIAQDRASVVIGSSSVGGSYYLYAGGLSTFINDNSETLQATAQTTRGSVENARLLAAGRLDFGFSNGGVVYEQSTGTGQFEGATADNIRGIAVIDIAPLHVVTFEQSGIEALSELEGKTVSVGAPGSGTANTAANMLEAAGLTGRIEIQNLGFDESAANLRDGNLDAFAASSAYPMPAVLDLSTSHSVRLLSIDDSVAQQLRELSPAYQQVTIPGGTYNGVDADVMSVGVPSMLITHADVPEDVVYEFVSQMFADEAGTYMRNVYNAWSPEPGAAAFGDISVSLHPGAERFYREMGLID